MAAHEGRSIATMLRYVAAPALALLTGCAHVYVDDDGTRHVAGFVWLTLPPADATGGAALRSRSVGLSLTRSEAGSALVLGYSDSTLAFVRNHSLVPAPALLLGHAALEIKADDTDPPSSLDLAR